MVNESLFKEAVVIFHPYDSDFYSLMDNLFGIYISGIKKYRKAIFIGRLMLTNVYQNCPHYCVTTGFHEQILAMLCNDLHLVEEAELHINRAKDIHEVTHGNGHPILTRDCRQIVKDIECTRNSLSKLDVLFPSRVLRAVLPNV